ncbi:hypothetical protein [Methylomonas sp. MgM2]
MLVRFIVLLLISQLCACVGPLAVGEFVIHATAHPATFEIARFRDQTTAVLPSVTPTAQIGYAPDVALALDRAIKDSSRALRYIPPHVSISLLNRYNLTESYSQMINGYRNVGILNKAALKAIAEALNADYVLLPVLAGFSQQTNDRLSQAITLIRTYSTQVNLTLQLWDARSGELVWQASGQATLASENIAAIPVAFTDTVHSLCKGMLEDLFEGRMNSRYSPAADFVGLH